MIKLMAQSKEEASKVHFVTDFSRQYRNQDIPDPYLGFGWGYHHVMNRVVDAYEGIYQELER